MDRRVTPPKWVTSPTCGPPPPCKQTFVKWGKALGTKTRRILYTLYLLPEDLQLQQCLQFVELLGQRYCDHGL